MAGHSLGYNYTEMTLEEIWSYLNLSQVHKLLCLTVKFLFEECLVVIRSLRQNLFSTFFKVHFKNLCTKF